MRRLTLPELHVLMGAGGGESQPGNQLSHRNRVKFLEWYRSASPGEKLRRFQQNRGR